MAYNGYGGRTLSRSLRVFAPRRRPWVGPTYSYSRGKGGGAGLGAFMWSDFRRNSGLGQTDDEYLGAQRILVEMINRESSRIASYISTPTIEGIRRKIEQAQTWFRGGMASFYSGDSASAMRMVTNGITVMHEVSRAVTALTPADKQAATAQTVMQQGASFSYQVGQTLSSPFSGITEPIASAVASISPAAGEAVRSAGWALIPIVGGALLVLLLRR